jgi:nucleotide-binding universal stress UspA family protein
MKPFAITNILAPTDLSDSSLPALRYARLFADCFGAKLTVMYTDPVVYPTDFAPVDDLDRLRNQVEGHAGPAMEGRLYDVDVTAGDPIPSILGAADERGANLIVVGTHLRHGWRRALLGSVSNGVLHGSRCPVLTVASHERMADSKGSAIRNVLCPVNFTQTAAESLNVAAAIACAFGALLTIVHVVETEDDVTFAHHEERVRRWIAPEIQDICSYRELVVRGGPAERVLDCADDLGADLLVVGAQHKVFRDATVIGATTERLIRFASCPVLVVPREVAPQAARAVKDAESMVVAGK